MNVIHYPPVNPKTSDRFARAQRDSRARIWAVLRVEEEGRSRIRVLRASPGTTGFEVIYDFPRASTPQRPDIWIAPDDTVHVVWNAVADDSWQIVTALIFADPDAEVPDPVVIAARPGLCQPPRIDGADGVLRVTWAQVVGGRSCIMLANDHGHGDWSVQCVSEDNGNAFRPALAANGPRTLVVWDEYVGKRYRVCGREIALNGEKGSVANLETGGADWLHPQVVRTAGGDCFLVWLQAVYVMDPDRGIVDQAASISGARWNHGRPEFLAADSSGDAGILADLRPGLLPAAGEPYRGYDALRRRPQLIAGRDGTVWLGWEARQASGGKRDGGFRARRIDRDPLPNPLALHQGGIGYSVVPGCDELFADVVFFDPGRRLEPALKTARLPLSHGKAGPKEPGRWRNWHAADVGVTPADRFTVATADGDLKLYWVDFHCHSSLSPDAEGDPDELLNYARNVAGLDAAAVVDNDYYPHKCLSDAEWALEQELARMFTCRGRFVVFPAYEYTYHDPDMQPDYNHRYVLFRSPPAVLRRRTDPGFETLEKLAAALSDEEAILVAHHPWWRLTGLCREAVEVCSSWRVCIEETHTVHERLAAGERFAFLATSDTHRQCPGMGGAITGIFAAELTPEALFDALCKRRTIASQGRRALIDCRVDDRFIGEEGPVSSAPTVRVNVSAPVPIEHVDIIRDGTVIARREPGDGSVGLVVEDSVGAGWHYWYVRVKMKGLASFNAPADARSRPFVMSGAYPSNLARAQGPFVWSTPVWGHVAVWRSGRLTRVASRQPGLQ